MHSVDNNDVDYDDDVDVEGGGTIKSWKIVKISHA